MSIQSLCEQTKVALADHDGVALAAMSEKLDMLPDEHAHYQNLKSIAVSEGRMSPEDGQYIYRMLGETPSVFNRQDVAVKIVLTQLFAKLMQVRLHA
jgi:hypothetical protein